MHGNTINAFLRKYEDTIDKLVELEEGGVNIRDFLNITMDIVNLLDRYKQTDTEIATLLNIIIECQGDEGADNGRSNVAE